MTDARRGGLNLYDPSPGKTARGLAHKKANSNG